MRDLNIRMGKGWINSKPGKGEDGTNGSNKEGEDKEQGNDEGDEDTNTTGILGKDENNIGKLPLDNYLPTNEAEKQAFINNPDEYQAAIKKVEKKQEGFEHQARKVHRNISKYRGLIKYTDLMVEKLTNYKQQKNSFPSDSDGLYILIEGNITIKNDFRPEDPDETKNLPKYDLIDKWTEWKFRGKDASQLKQRNQRSQGNQDRPETMYLIGVEKFLQVQGYSYYGCAYAQTDKKGGTSCGFIKKELLYLIPFYDLYQMKKDLAERYKVKCKKYAEIDKELYEFALRKMNSGEK